MKIAIVFWLLDRPQWLKSAWRNRGNRKYERRDLSPAGVARRQRFDVARKKLQGALKS